MHKYNKIRGILRAKQGSQIPKYLYGNFIPGPGGMIYDGYNNRLDNMLYFHLINPYNTGSLQPSSLFVPSISNLLGSNPIGDLTQANITAANNYINNNIDANGNLNAMQEPTTLDLLKLANPNAFLWNLPTIIPDSAKIRPTFGQRLKIVGKGLGKKAIDFAGENQGLVTSGINTTMNSIDNTKNSSTFNIASGALQTASKIPGVVGWAATGANALLRGINKFTSKTIDTHTMSEQEKSKAGNYGGMLALNNKVSALEGVEFGGIGGGSEYREGKRDNNELLRLLNIWREISNTADNQFAMAGNDIYLLGYEMLQNGGYPTQFLRASKQGGTLTQKIDIVKSRKFNQVINVDTKLVEEFKEGGKLEISEWEPVIELFEEWEPEIILEVEEFKDGGNIDTAATISDWWKGTWSYLSGNKDSGLLESLYKPSKSNDPNVKYYYREGLNNDVVKNILGGSEYGKKDLFGEDLFYKDFNDVWNRLSNLGGRAERNTDNSHLGAYTIGIGEDSKGRYISYYDKFDWAPDGIKELFHPYEIYNRIYEDEFNRMQESLNGIDYKGSNPSGNWFFKSGKELYNYIKNHKEGGSIKESDIPEIEETNQKNLIPEGALHKNKHHMEHAEGLTQKGIPVVDNEGEQLAEIELDEIIFTLEVTKKLEELYRDGSDEAAIEAGKLLVKEILFNTDDRTGLIAKCEKGGKL